MISFAEAFRNVLEHPLELGEESVSLEDCNGRVLAEDLLADRNFPPFDRSTKDGIALHFSAIERGIDRLKIEGVLSAGMPQQTLSSEENCVEIMTGAVLPKNADTIVMYEQVQIDDGWAVLDKRPKKGQNIHKVGSDKKSGECLLKKGVEITAAVIGILASVGKTKVLVKKLPKVCVISTGNELVEISQTPLPHQIRKSNSYSLKAALKKCTIEPTLMHLPDNPSHIKNELKKVLATHDVLMLSGGVSKGKFDFIPDALDALGIQKIFHRVAQRPGKPFWFGIQPTQKKVVFSFPGNPVSTFANHHIYFLPWLAKSLGQVTQEQTIILNKAIQPHPTLTLFLQVKTEWQEGQLHASLVRGNGSGDLVSLAQADGFIRIPPGEENLKKDSAFRFIPVG